LTDIKLTDMTIAERCEHRLNVLEACLCENVHLSDSAGVQRLLNRITKWYSSLSDSDQAYCDSAQRIIDEQIPYDGS